METSVDCNLGISPAQQRALPLVVTAQKRAENAQDVPLSISAVSGDSLRTLQIQSPRDLLMIDPSIKFRAGNSTGSSAFLIRGVGTASFSQGVEQSVSTVVDVVVVANPTTVASLTDVDRVEILHGSQGMLFRNMDGLLQLLWVCQGDVNFQPNGELRTIQEAYGTLDANAGVASNDGRWRIAAFATNLLDKRFVAQISPFPVTAWSPGTYTHYFSLRSVRTIGVSLDARL